MSEARDWVVLKFGGTSVATAERWRTIASLAQARLADGARPLLVCSALRGVSDLLVALADDALAGDPEPTLQALRARHTSLAAELEIRLPEPVDAELRALGQIARGVGLLGELSPRIRARILAAGERMSTQLGVVALRSLGVDVAWVDVLTLLQAEDQPEAAPDRRWLSARCVPGPDVSVRATLDGLDAAVALTRASSPPAPGASRSCSGGAARTRPPPCSPAGSTPSAVRSGPTSRACSRPTRAACRRRGSCAPSTTPRPRRSRPPAPRCCTPPASCPPGRPASPSRSAARPRPSSSHADRRPRRRQRRGQGGERAAGVVLVSMETVGMWQQVGFLARATACIASLASASISWPPPRPT